MWAILISVINCEGHAASHKSVHKHRAAMWAILISIINYEGHAASHKSVQKPHLLEKKRSQKHNWIDVHLLACQGSSLITNIFVDSVSQAQTLCDGSKSLS